MLSSKFNRKIIRRNLPPSAPARVQIPLFDATQVLFDHACDTLPDSLASRRLVLQALKIKLHPGHPAYVQICAQIAAVDAIAELQKELRLALARLEPVHSAIRPVIS
jgi:hypothetical protein